MPNFKKNGLLQKSLNMLNNQNNLLMKPHNEIKTNDKKISPSSMKAIISDIAVIKSIIDNGIKESLQGDWKSNDDKVKSLITLSQMSKQLKIAENILVKQK